MANLKATNDVQEPTGNKPIRLLSEAEYTQVTQLKRLCEFWTNADAYSSYDELEAPILTLVKTTLGYRDQDQNQTAEDTITEDDEQEQENNKTSTYRKNTKLPFEHRNDLLGKSAPNHMAIKTAHYKGNPYKIPIDRYVKCPQCDKVAVSNMKVEVKGDITDVWQRFRHDENQHWVRVDRFQEALSWEQVFERKIKSNKNHSLDVYKYPKKEQLSEVEDPIEEDEGIAAEAV